VDGRTPFEAWFGQKLDVHFLTVSGCKAHAKVTHPNLKKLNDHSAPVIFLDYEPGGKAYRCYNPVCKRVVMTRDVVFDEGQSWPWTTNGNENPSNDITVEYTVHGGAPDQPSEEQKMQEDRAPAEKSAATENQPKSPVVVGSAANNSANLGSIVSPTAVFDDEAPPQQHPMVTRSCDGIFKLNTRLADYVLGLEDEDSREEPRIFAGRAT
jgi:hypothetical protein